MLSLLNVNISPPGWCQSVWYFKIITNSMTAKSCYKYDNKMLIYTKLGNCQYKQNIWKISTQDFSVNSCYLSQSQMNK